MEIIVAAVITAAGSVAAAWIGRRGQAKRSTRTETDTAT
jgi:hypothetical protein